MNTYSDYHRRNAQAIVDFMKGPYVASNSTEFWEAMYPSEYDLFHERDNYPLIFLKKYLRFTNILYRVDDKTIFDHIIEAFMDSARYLLDTSKSQQDFKAILDLLLTQGEVAQFQEVVRQWTTLLTVPEKSEIEDVVMHNRVRAFIINHFENKIVITDQMQFMKSYEPVSWEDLDVTHVSVSHVMSDLHYNYNQVKELHE
jgi:hypothetical protein